MPTMRHDTTFTSTPGLAVRITEHGNYDFARISDSANKLRLDPPKKKYVASSVVYLLPGTKERTHSVYGLILPSSNDNTMTPYAAGYCNAYCGNMSCASWNVAFVDAPSLIAAYDHINRGAFAGVELRVPECEMIFGSDRPIP